MSENLAEKKWYIATTQGGHEQKAAENIRRRIESFGLQKYVMRVVVAEEKVNVYKDGKQVMVKNKETGLEEPKTKINNLYPGYVFVQMIMTDESWYMVRNTPEVTGIAGSSGGGQKPTPVKNSEMEIVLKRIGEKDETLYKGYNVGDIVKIVHGMFDGVEGKISAVDQENGKVVVNASFFGRITPIEIDMSEIIRV